jgi:hypothetical protein
MISFGVGLAVGSALWGDCDWGHGDVDIDVNNYNNFNKTNIQNKKWEHNNQHRKGVEYRDKASRERYGRASDKGMQSRDAFRGRAEQGRQSLPQQKDLARAGGAGDRPRGAGKDRPGGQNRPATDRSGGGQRADRPAERPRHEGLGQGRDPNAFKDIGNGREVRQASDRGRQSSQSAQRHFGGGGGGYGGGGGAGGGRGGGGRGGGGGGRGGGGRRGR